MGFIIIESDSSGKILANPPKVEILAPSPGTVDPDTTPTFIGTASVLPGDSATVTVYVSNLGASLPFMVLPTTRDAGGAWSVTASALTTGNAYQVAAIQETTRKVPAGADGPVPFAVGTGVAPDVQILSPGAGSSVPTATPLITGKGTPGTPVTVLIKQGATTLQTLTPTPDATGSWAATTTGLADGAYTVTASQTVGGLSDSDGPRSFTVAVTAPPPTPVVEILAPADGSTIGDSTPPIVGSGTGSTSAAVRIKQGATLIQSLTAPITNGVWLVTANALPNGTYTVEASQTEGGQTGDADPITFTLTATASNAPTVTMTSPSPNLQTTVRRPTFAGTCSNRSGDSAQITIRLFQGGTQVDQTTLTRSSPTQWALGNWYQDLPLGTYQARAEQTNSLASPPNDVGFSPTVTFTVKAVPALTINAPTEDELRTTNPVAVEGGAGNAAGDSANITLKVYLGGATSPLHTQTVIRSGGNWTTNLTATLVDGSYRLTAEQVGAVGTTTVTRHFALASTGPPLAIPRGAVNGFAQAADFNDSVGVVQHPEYIRDANPAATSMTTAIQRLQELGVRHVRMGLYSPSNHTDGNYQYKSPNFLPRERSLRGSNQPIFGLHGLGVENAQSGVKRSYTATNGNGLRALDGPTGAVSATNWTTEPDKPPGGGVKYVAGTFYADDWGTVSGLQGPNEPNTRPHTANGVGSIRELVQAYSVAKNARTTVTVLGGGDYVSHATGRITAGPAKANQIPTVGFALTDATAWTEFGDYTDGSVDVGCLHVYFGGAEPRVGNVWGKTQSGSAVYRSTGYNGTLSPSGGRTYPLPWFVTETGYIQIPSFDKYGGQRYCPPDVAGEYLIRTMIHNHLYGAVRTYIFSLVDISDNCFGLVDNNFVRRASFYAIKNLLALIPFSQGSTSVPITVGIAGFVPKAENLHTEAGGGRGSGSSPDRLNTPVYQIDDDTYVVVLQRDRMLWDRGNQTYKVPAASDRQVLTLTLPPGFGSPAVAEPAKNTVKSPDDGYVYPNPTDGTAYSTVGIAGVDDLTPDAQNKIKVGISGLTRVVRIQRQTGGPTRLVLGFNSSKTPEQMGQAIDEWQAQVGAPPVMAMYYGDWYEGWSTAIINPPFTNPATARGVIPLITWEPSIGAATHQPAYALARITAGDHDAYIQRAAAEVVAFGLPVFIRFAHEMNGNWSSWDRGQAGNTPAGYIAAWRHVVNLFRAEGATNALWMWSPNVYGDPASTVVPFGPYYPGDGWVDWVALDGYNSGGGGGWRTFSQVFQSSYNALSALTNKPMIIGETASAEAGGDKANWITVGLGQTVPNAMPNVRAVVWFDRLKETDWRVASSPASLAAFRAVVATGLYSGTAGDLLS